MDGDFKRNNQKCSESMLRADGLTLCCLSGARFRYYRFNEASRSVDDGYPKSISVWQGVPDNIKAAFMSKDQGNRGDVGVPRL